MNRTILQYFEWYLPADGSLWRQLTAAASTLKDQGFTDLWLPPAYKGAAGQNDVGYGVYDLYDLGEFDQKGSIATKYGTRDEYLEAIAALHAQGLRVIADVVLNHRMGADFAEDVNATDVVAENNRNEEIEGAEPIAAWTGFNFPGRHDRYSNFHWNHTHFSAVGWDDKTDRSEIFQLTDKRGEAEVDQEKGNYDYLLGSDVDVSNPAVIAELDRWGQWYLETTQVDGLRLDAVKHINFEFFKHWLAVLRRHSSRDLFAVGEYWQRDVAALTYYLDRIDSVMTLFDVPLHYNLEQASQQGDGYDMRQLFDNTLLKLRADHAVTFVDDHDTQPGQALFSWVAGWFKPLAYAIILLREQGIPCVFYGDLYGIPHDNIDPVGDRLFKLVQARAERAYGEQIDYFDHPNTVGWVRRGDPEHPHSGLAVVMSNSAAGNKTMSMGASFAHQTFVDLLDNCPGEVTLNETGEANFPCSAGSVSVWIPRP